MSFSIWRLCLWQIYPFYLWYMFSRSYLNPLLLESWNCWMDKSRGRGGCRGSYETESALHCWVSWWDTKECRCSYYIRVKSLGPIMFRGICDWLFVISIFRLYNWVLFVFVFMDIKLVQSWVVNFILATASLDYCIGWVRIGTLNYKGLWVGVEPGSDNIKDRYYWLKNGDTISWYC